MTTEQRERLAAIRNFTGDYKYNDHVLYCEDLEAEHEAILQLCRDACHPGCEPGKHDLAYKILVLAGERT